MECIQTSTKFVYFETLSTTFKQTDRFKVEVTHYYNTTNQAEENK